MKFLAGLLLVCIAFVSSFPAAIVPPMDTTDVEGGCCFQLGEEDGSCHRGTEDPGAGECQRMFSCHICVLLAIAPHVFEPKFNQTPVFQFSLFDIGAPSGFPPLDWKPPRAV